MKKILLFTFLFLFLLIGTSQGQVPSIGPPVNLDLGIGGGVSLPNGKLSDADNTGFHVGAKARLHGFMPMNIPISAYYNRLPNKVGGETDVAWMLGAGLEYPIPSVSVKPYLGADALWNVMSNTGSGSSSVNRGGLGVGAGVEFSIPSLGSFDTSVKYQIFNLVGKEASEETFSQIVASVALMFSVL